MNTSNGKRYYLSQPIRLFCLLVFCVNAQAENVLDRFASTTAKANYCYYSHTINVKNTSRGPNKLAVLPLIQTLSVWKGIVNTLSLDRKTGNQHLSDAIAVFNREVEEHAKNQGSQSSEAQQQVIARSKDACQMLLTELRSGDLQPEPSPPDVKTPVAGRHNPPVTSPNASIAKSRTAVRSTVAADWTNNSDFVGAWFTPQVNYRFKHASSIQFQLWKSKAGLPEGVAIFNKQQQRCVGTLAIHTDSGKLTFTPVEGNSCEGLDGAYYNIMRGISNNMMMLTFLPADADDNEIPKLQLTNTAYYRKFQQAPATLKEVVARLRDSDQTPQQRAQELASEHADALARARTTLQQQFIFHFADAKLIGVWQGHFIDSKRRFAAEIALWSSKPYRLQQVVGLVHFEGNLCDTGIVVTDDGKSLQWVMGPGYLDSAPDACRGVKGQGTVRLGKTGDILAINFESHVNDPESLSREHCLDDLPHPDKDAACYSPGLFKRADASDELKQVIANTGWKRVKAPSPADWAILQRNDAELAKLQATHVEMVKRNPQIVAQIESERAEIERKQQEERQRQIEHNRQKAAAEKARRERVRQSWEEQRGAKPGTAPQLDLASIEPPEIRGPFDGLPGSDFLNALYHGDFEAVAQFNRYYGERKVQQRRAWLGSEPHWSDNIQNSAFRSMRLQDTVLAIYLFSYDSRYADCLRDDAVTFEVVKEVPDTVIENMLGVEVMRYYGWTERNQYKINKEFTNAFRRIGRTEPEGAMATVSDFLLNQGGTDLRRTLISGSKQMLGKFDCNSEPVRRLEKSLLALAG